jgi:hypothetical protein
MRVDRFMQELQDRTPLQTQRLHHGQNALHEPAAGGAVAAERTLTVALSRYGGLQCPSEHPALTRSDVDWVRDRFRVTSPKTAHHAGKGDRSVPLFPELRPYLEEGFELTPEWAVHVIRRYRDIDKDFRTRLTRIMRRAGPKTVAQAFPQPPGKPGNRAGRRPPAPRGVRVDWQLSAGRTAALSPGDRSRLRAGGPSTQRAKHRTKRQNSAKCGAQRVAPNATPPCVAPNAKTPLRIHRKFAGLTITPGGIRTPNPRFRRPMLCPVELRAQVIHKTGTGRALFS